VSAVARACVVCDDGTGAVRAALTALGQDARRARLEGLWNAAQSEHADARRMLGRVMSAEARVRAERRVFLFQGMLGTLREELDELRAEAC
jgi:hypothetical protein